MVEAEFLRRIEASCVAMPRASFAPGDVFGDYRVMEFLAAGGTAEVYRVEHIMLGTLAALKVSKVADAAACTRIEREARLLMELRSDCFPQFYGCGTAQGRAYLVEELLSREEAELEHAELTVADFCRLCASVAELHARGIAHGDLKPANVLFRKGGTPVLIDIGCLAGMGTRGYAAPEQLLGGEATVAADVHALGVMAERLFAGRPPRAWRTIIRRATSSLAEERYADAAVLLRGIRRMRALRFFACLGLGLSVLAATLVGSYSLVHVEPPRVFDLASRTLILSHPLTLRSHEVCRVIGPGTLDAEILGSSSATLWMTNCIVLNRTSSPCLPQGPVYELTGNAYLNFTCADEPTAFAPDRLRVKNPSTCHVRYRGPQNWADLAQELNFEYFSTPPRERRK